MSNEIRMAGERAINKETKRMKIDETMVDVMLPMMMCNIESASKLNEEDFYLLDCLIKCKLIFNNIEVSEDYSTNVKNLLDYCKKESNEEMEYHYTYVLLTHNNINTMIRWILDNGKKESKLTCSQEKTLNSLINLKECFYENNVSEWIKDMREIEKERQKLIFSEE